MADHPRPLRLASVAYVTGLALSGCALFVSFDDVRLDDDASTGGAGGQGASSAGGGSAGMGGGDGGAPVVCTLYVSPEGDDESDGRSPEAPIGSIHEGLTIATESAQPEQICVCVGSFVEPPLSIRRNVGLRGGLSCETWERSAEVDYPTLGGTEIRVQGSPTLPTLAIESADVDQSTVIDGFRIIGSPGTTVAGARVAVTIQDAARPRIEHCYIEGDVTQPGALVPSVGVMLTEGAAPTLEGVRIVAGDGHFDGSPAIFPASAALVSIGASAVVSHSWLEAGFTTEASSGGTAGVYARDSTLTLTSSHVDGGSGEAPGEPLAGSIGVFVWDSDAADPPASLTLEGSVVDAGRGLGLPFASQGVAVLGVASVTLQGNAIHGGEGNGRRAGVTLVGVANAVVSSNMIFGGASASAEATRALHLASPLGGSFLISHNTLEAGGSSMGASLAVTEIIDSLHIELEHNLLLAQGRTGILIESALGTPIDVVFDTLVANAFIDPQTVAFNGATAMSASDLESVVGPGGNVRLAVTCPTSPADPLCVASPDCMAAGCGMLVMYEAGEGAAVQTTVDGLPPGWPLDPSAPLVCGELQDTSGTSVLHPRFVDYFGADRDVPETIGAHEVICP